MRRLGNLRLHSSHTQPRVSSKRPNSSRRLRLNSLDPRDQLLNLTAPAWLSPKGGLADAPSPRARNAIGMLFALGKLECLARKGSLCLSAPCREWKTIVRTTLCRRVVFRTFPTGDNPCARADAIASVPFGTDWSDTSKSAWTRSNPGEFAPGPRAMRPLSRSAWGCSRVRGSARGAAVIAGSSGITGIIQSRSMSLTCASSVTTLPTRW